ncbi:nucleotidyltransferase substrate binding protein [Dyadobacter helix]|nr:nucleotidyltransferase substrate binding protein [Dyadobacter sp. CECT 9275]
MMKIDTTYLERCIAALERAYSLLIKSEVDTIEYDMFRSASIKEFEIILEQAGKLLRKALKPYFHSPKEVDRMVFKNVFRNAVLRDLITDEQCERWLQYRDNRNNTAHDYGVNFANETLVFLPQFIKDSMDLSAVLKNQNDQ